MKKWRNESFSKHCTVLTSKMNKKFLTLGSSFWPSDRVVFKGKQAHTHMYTYDVVKQNSRQSFPCSSSIGVGKPLSTYDHFISLTLSHSGAKVTKINLSWAQKFHLPFRDFLNEMIIMNTN